MEHHYELTPCRYFFKLTKYFIKSFVAYCLKKDEELEKLYYHTMDIHIEYIEKYYDEEEKEESFKERIYELLELIVLREQTDSLKIKGKTYRGLKLRENIIHNMYVELWLIEKNLHLLIYEKAGNHQELLPFNIEFPYLLRLDQVYYSLKNKRIPGLLVLLYESKHA
ncbi:hypothetical protein [Crassaminicella profunda]|uniref:hypothetical protein n=1 Tax=Crassaminicella profunda TaxID=1286698 RepID=UPI001CA78BF4|nr:hypothetical protein [Crassaminicella profunda]QZY55000.1 hypothetical protein K7H06_18610 [Crassaminicella profunda]